ncbi:hypothetical protein Droror1_Dr00025276, partial [Drosera rotundifolia]
MPTLAKKPSQTVESLETRVSQDSIQPETLGKVSHHANPNLHTLGNPSHHGNPTNHTLGK